MELPGLGILHTTKPSASNPNTAGKPVTQSTPNSAFNPAVASFNPCAPTFQPTGTRSTVRGTSSLSGGFNIATPATVAIASPEVENPFRPQWDGVFSELSAPRQSPILFGALRPPPQFSSLPTASSAEGRDGATTISSPYARYESRAIGGVMRPKIDPAVGWGFDGPMEHDIHAFLKGQKKASSPLGRAATNALGMGLGMQFTEEQWRRLGAPVQFVYKDSEIESQTRTANQLGPLLGDIPEHQSKSIKPPTMYVNSELTQGSAINPTTMKAEWLPPTLNEQDIMKNRRTRVPHYPDKAIIPRATPPIFQPVPTPRKPTFLPSRTLNTPLDHVSHGNGHEPVDYSNRHHAPMGGSAFHQQLPQSVVTPNVSYGDFHAHRYGTRLSRPSTTKSQSRSQRGKRSSRQKPRIPRMKRTDQGPLPSSADIYPDDAQFDNGPPTFPRFEYENFCVTEQNKHQDDANAARGPTVQWAAKVQDELRRQAEAEAQHSKYLQSQEVMHELEELIRSPEMHHPQNGIYRRDIHQYIHQYANGHDNLDVGTDPKHSPIHINLPPPPELIRSPVLSEAADKQRIILPSPPPPTTLNRHPPRFSVFDPNYYRTDDQVKASTQSESRPLSPGQLDGSRYGMQFWGIGLGDAWHPVKVEVGTRFRVRPREHAGWGGWQWVRELEVENRG